MSVTSIENAIVCFIDILGYRNMVTAPGDRMQIAARLDAAIRRALEAFGGIDALRGTPDAEWRVRVFSDCLCAAKPLSELGVASMLDAISMFTQEMLSASFPIRGGVELGPYADNELLLFSSAQISAYDLESQVAKHPRVVLSPALIDYIDAVEDDEYRWIMKELIILDRGSLPFVNYMVFYEEDDWQGGSAFYRLMKNLITKMLKRTDVNPRLREKYIWMAALHNWSLKHTSKLLKLSGTLSEDTVWSFTSYHIDECPSSRSFRPLIALDPSFKRLSGETRGWFFNNGWLHKVDKTRLRKDIDWLREWPGVTSVDDEKPDYTEDDGDINPNK